MVAPCDLSGMKVLAGKGLTRRELLFGAGAAALLIGCGQDGAAGQGVDGGVDGGGDGGDGGLLDPTPPCDEHETDDNIEGPYYKAGAPFVNELAGGLSGTLLALSGRVKSQTCEPLAGALIDLWQANDAGAYDQVGWTLRGKTVCDAAGAYRFSTIIPGHYLNGAQYRPAHIHVKVSAPGYVLLTTQLYFVGDPYNDIDPFIKPSLIMTPADVVGGKAARFDFVLITA
jgi:protocatechuate 3,4-dioxygenase beta subunit